MKFLREVYRYRDHDYRPIHGSSVHYQYLVLG